MYLLRRTAARTICSTPSKAIFNKPRPITTYGPSTFRPRQQQWIALSFQRRFASDERTKPESAADNFAQTATDAPVDDAVTPAPEPTDSSATVGIEALEAAPAQSSAPENNKTPAGLISKPNRIVYVGNLFYEVTEDQLKRVFSRFGSINSANIVFDHRGLSRGFGYVEFENVADAQAAVENLDMQVFEGRNLVVQFHRPKSTGARKAANGEQRMNPPSKTLFIGNMSFEMSDKDLNDLFRDIRNVMDVRVAIDRRTGQPRGFAHADFIDIPSATRAREVLKDKVIYGRQLRVDFSTSGSSQQRQNRPDTV